MRTQVIYIKLRDWLIPALQPHWSISTNQCMYSISPANLVCCFVNNRLLGSTVDIPLDHVYKVRVDSYLIYSVQPALWRCVCNHHLCLPWFYWRCCVRSLMHSGTIQHQTIAILDVCSSFLQPSSLLALVLLAVLCSFSDAQWHNSTSDHCNLRCMFFVFATIISACLGSIGGAVFIL